MIELFYTHYNYIVAIFLFSIGLYMIIADKNFVKKVIGLNIFQTGIFLVFITSAFINGGYPPVVSNEGPYVSPLPHVLILTAIVVSISLTAFALTLIVRIYSEYGTLREDVLEDIIKNE